MTRQLASRKFAIAVLGALALLVAAGALAAVRQRSERAAAAWVAHSYHVIATLESVAEATTRAVAAQRTYLLLRTPDALVQLRDAEREAAHAARTARRLTADNRLQQLRVDTLEAALGTTLGALHAAVPMDGAPLVDTPLGCAAPVDALVARMNATERELLARRRSDSAAAGFAERMATLFTLALSILLGAAAVGNARRDAGARNAAERALIESEDRYRGLVEHSPDAIFVHVRGNFVYANAAAVALLGARSVDDLLGRNVFDTVHPEDREAVRAKMRAVVAGGPAQPSEMRLLTLAGAVVEAECLGVPTTAEGESAIQVMARDIAWRRRAEQDARDGDRRARAAIDASLDEVYVLRSDRDEAGRVRDFVIVDANARAAAQLRTPREALAGRRLADLAPLDPWLFDEIVRVAERGAAFERELPDRDPRARGRWVHLQIVPLGDGVMMTSRDVTERRRAVEELEAREERYRTMARYFPNGMVALLDRELCFLVADGAGLSTAGFTRDDLEGRRLVDTFPARIVGVVAPTLEAALRGEEAAAKLEMRGRTYSTLAVPVRDGGGAVTSVLLIAQDVTERAAMERLKGELVATVSHELRTPLTSIRGALGLMEAGTAGVLPEQASTLVRIARSNTDRLIRLVNDVLDLEKIEARKVDYRMQTLRASDVVGPAAEGMHAAALLAGVRIVQDVRTVRPFVGDRDRLLQVLTNLLSNAVKFAPTGSEVVLRATDHTAARGTLRLVVEGGGPGIPADKLGGLFEKFHQVDASDARARGGTGLGLAITRAIVEQHGGCVGVESEPGVRTAFWCELPAA